MAKFSLALALAVCFVTALGEPVFEQQLYEIRDNDDAVCASFRMAAKFVPAYKKKDSTDRVSQEVYLPSVNETYSNRSTVNLEHSTCRNQDGVVELVVNFARQIFTLTVTSIDGPSVRANGNWSVSKIQVVFNFADAEIFPDTNDTSVATFEILNPPVSTTDGNGGLYKCNSPVDLKLNGTMENPIELTLKDVLLNPFEESTDEPVVECSADSKSSSDKIVPIAVGCALGGLLLIVIIAFLIGKRSRKAEYTKV